MHIYFFSPLTSVLLHCLLFLTMCVTTQIIWIISHFFSASCSICKMLLHISFFSSLFVGNCFILFIRWFRKFSFFFISFTVLFSLSLFLNALRIQKFYYFPVKWSKCSSAILRIVSAIGFVFCFDIICIRMQHIMK